MATTPPWEESRHEEAFTFHFKGIDAVKREELELAHFKSALNTPADERGADGTVIPRGRGLPPRYMAAVILGLAVSYGAAFLVVQLFAALGWPHDGSMVLALTLAFAVALVLGVPLVLGWKSFWSGSPSLAGTYRIDIGTKGVSFSNERGGLALWTLHDIERFEGHRRLEVVKNDGSKEALLGVLPNQSEHAAFAARLNEVLAETRATAGGYRG